MDKFKDLGLLVMRLGIGFSVLYFRGYDHLINGNIDRWTRMGQDMRYLGIDFFPAVWGFTFSLAEFVGAILLMVGALFRPAAALLAFTMFVAVFHHVRLPLVMPGSGWEGASEVLELAVICLGFFLVGPGKFAFTVKRTNG